MTCLNSEERELFIAHWGISLCTSTFPEWWLERQLAFDFFLMTTLPNICIKLPWVPRLEYWLTSWTSKPARVSLSFTGCPIHLALCHIKAKSLINHYIKQPFSVTSLGWYDLTIPILIFLDINICAHGVMDTVVGKGHDNISSNSGRDYFHFILG